MTFVIYLVIAIVVMSVFILVFQLSQKTVDRHSALQAVKSHTSIVIQKDESNLNSIALTHNTQKTVEKLRSLETDNTNDSFIQKIHYKLVYIYDDNPNKNGVILAVKSCIVILVMTYLIGIPLIWGLLISIFLGLITTNILITRLFDRRIAQFLDNFVYAMDIIVRGLRSGLSTNQCFLQIAKDSEPVVAEQFLAMVEDYKFGMNTEQVMYRFMKRLPLSEVNFFCLSILIQSKTGGNLAEIITNLSKILRNRKSLLLKIQTLSSEAKTSAIIMSCMPLGIIGILSIIAPDYVDVFFTELVGKLVLGGCLTWMGIGAMIMRSMINFYK